MAELSLHTYGNGQYAVGGNTKKWRGNLKALGCSYRPSIPNLGAGWTFPLVNLDIINGFIAQANAGTITPNAVEPAGERSVVSQVVPKETQQAVMTPQAALQRLANHRPTIATPLPPQPTVLTHPNLFVGADGLDYQIIVMTAPLPHVGQTVEVAWQGAVLRHVVVSLESTTFPCNSITISPVGVGEQPISRATITAGRWQIQGLYDEHTVTFLRPQTAPPTTLPVIARPATRSPIVAPIVTTAAELTPPPSAAELTPPPAAAELTPPAVPTVTPGVLPDLPRQAPPIPAVQLPLLGSPQ